MADVWIEDPDTDHGAWPGKDAETAFIGRLPIAKGQGTCCVADQVRPDMDALPARVLTEAATTRGSTSARVVTHRPLSSNRRGSFSIQSRSTSTSSWIFSGPTYKSCPGSPLDRSHRCAVTLRCSAGGGDLPADHDGAADPCVEQRLSAVLAVDVETGRRRRARSGCHPQATQWCQGRRVPSR